MYIDYLPNLPGKTLAAPYSARVNAFAGVSAPLRCEDLDEAFQPQDFTIVTIHERLKRVGDLWARLENATGVNLHASVPKKG